MAARGNGMCSGSFNNDVHDKTFFQENGPQSPRLATIDGYAIMSLYHHDLYEEDYDETEEINQRGMFSFPLEICIVLYIF